MLAMKMNVVLGFDSAEFEEAVDENEQSNGVLVDQLQSCHILSPSSALLLQKVLPSDMRIEKQSKAGNQSVSLQLIL
jgi:hypothetical protein